MKILKVRAYGLRGFTPEGGWAAELAPDDCIHTLIEVLTDEGVSGWGSCFTDYGLVQAAVAHLEPHWKGETPLEPERVSEKLHARTFWTGRGGSVTHAISGIDMALWDILGKVTGQPVGRLLGGRYRTSVRPYASTLARSEGELVEQLSRLRETGFSAFKIGWGKLGRHSYETDEAIVRAARGAIGPDADLMVDAGGSDAGWPNDIVWARRTADMLASYNVEWFEEPLNPDALEDFRDLRRSAPVRIAGGEVLTRRQTFATWLAARAFDIVQPDVTKVGGLSEMRRIGWMAEAANIRLIPHGWNTALGLAADLQLAAALPQTDLVEYLPGSPYIDELIVGGWELQSDGTLKIPDTPGLGVEIDRDRLKALSRF